MQYAGHDAVTGLEILKLNENDDGSVSQIATFKVKMVSNYYH